MKKFISDLKEGMTIFGSFISTLINSILLIIVYLFGIGITAIIAKTIGKSFLQKVIGGESYWQELDLSEDKDSFYRQF